MTPEMASEPRKPLSELSRLTGVFYDPKETFRDVLLRPRWIVPVLLMVVCALTISTIYGQRVGWEKVVRQQMEQSSRTQEMSAEQREQAIAMGVKFGSVVAYVQSVIGPFIGVFVIGGVLMFAANAMLGVEIKYPQMLGITGYSFMPGVVSTALTILVMYLKPPEDFDIRNPLAFNAGAFMADDAPKWLAALASSIDLFSFWMIALLAIGISAAGKKLTMGKALGPVVGCWLVWVILKVGWTAMFG